MIILGLGHKARSGKDLMGAYLVSNYGFQRLSFADALYSECASMKVYVGDELAYDGMKEKDGLLLQWWGTNVRRHQNPDYWVQRLTAKVALMEDDARIVITDMRFSNEAAAIKSLGGTTIKIHRPNRPDIGRDPNHPSEIDLDHYFFDRTIENDGTIDDFLVKIDGLMLGMDVGPKL